MSKLKKRIISLGLALVLVLTMIPMFGVFTFAEEEEEDGTLFVRLTVSNQGEFAVSKDGDLMAFKRLYVEDLNQDGLFTLDEAMICAHEVYLGSAEEFGMTEMGWVTKLWGIENPAGYSFFIENQPTEIVTDTILSQDDSIVVSINQDDVYYNDFYAYFNTQVQFADPGEEVGVTLFGYPGMASDPEAQPLPGIGLAYYDASGEGEIEYKVLNTQTDENGLATVSFDKEGFYILTASGVVKDQEVYDWSKGEVVTADSPIMAPFLCFEVTDGSEEKADYSMVDSLMEDALYVIGAREYYSRDSVDELIKVVNHIVFGMPESLQDDVDDFAAALEEALENVEDIEPVTICFDGDSDYAGEYYYLIYGKDDKIEHLNITAVDEYGREVPEDLYNLSTYSTWYDEEQDTVIKEPVTEPLGLEEGSEQGFSRYCAEVQMKEDPEINLVKEFRIVDVYSLALNIPEIRFENGIYSGIWNMVDRYGIDINLIDPVVQRRDGVKLEEGKDFEACYYTAGGDPDADDADFEQVIYGGDPIEGLPKTAGFYVYRIKGIGDYYEENAVLLEVTGKRQGETGWFIDQGVRKYKIDDEIVKGWLVTDQGTFYMDPETGALLTGWQWIKGYWYYFDPGYGVMQTGWIRDGGKWYYLNPSDDSEAGRMLTGWVNDNGIWYYLYSSGAMATGWVKVDNVWYFLHAHGAMAANEWIQGYWLNGDGSWTYKPIGSWRRNNKGWWYGDTSGWYASAGGHKIDGVVYFFDDSGYFIH